MVSWKLHYQTCCTLFLAKMISVLYYLLLLALNHVSIINRLEEYLILIVKLTVPLFNRKSRIKTCLKAKLNKYKIQITLRNLFTKEQKCISKQNTNRMWLSTYLQRFAYFIVPKCQGITISKIRSIA